MDAAKSQIEVDEIHESVEGKYLLTRNLSNSFFRPQYDKHTNFSIEIRPQHISGSFGFGKTVESTLEKESGDFIGKMYLELLLPPLTIAPGSTYTGWTNSMMHACIEEIGLVIGGLIVDRKPGKYLEIVNELHLDEDKVDGYNTMIGKYENPLFAQTSANTERRFYVKCPFFHCNDSSTFLPVFALTRNEIKVYIKFRKFRDSVTFDGTTIPSEVPFTFTQLLVDYIHVSDQERCELLKKNHLVYLIEEVQEESFSLPANGGSEKVPIRFDHPVKCLYWVANEQTSIQNNDYFNYANRTNGENLIERVSIETEGKVRVPWLHESYYRQVEPCKNHKKVPNKYIYTYSFSMDPGNTKSPSGHINMTMYDNISMLFETKSTSTPKIVDVYGVNWNYFIVDIEKGQGSIAFRN